MLSAPPPNDIPPPPPPPDALPPALPPTMNIPPIQASPRPKLVSAAAILAAKNQMDNNRKYNPKVCISVIYIFVLTLN